MCVCVCVCVFMCVQTGLVSNNLQGSINPTKQPSNLAIYIMNSHKNTCKYEYDSSGHFHPSKSCHIYDKQKIGF